jgi:thiamine biosynthesis lipoprotein
MKAAQPSGAAFLTEDAAGVHRFSHEAMNSVFEVHCVHADAGYVAQAAQAAFDIVDRLEQELSRFIANSDVSRINALAGGGSTRVSPSTLDCLAVARHLYELTGGIFDVTIGTGWERLALEPKGFVVRALEPGARLDLGGIGKGYAVDRMSELLTEWDVPHALVHGGFSSVRALDAPPGSDGWALRLRAPDGGRVLARLSAHREAFGASGVQKGVHITDPRSASAATLREAAWVRVAADEEPGEGSLPAAVADALSTAFMILSAEEIGSLCDRHAELKAWLA